jgi:hypothetical protein
LRPEAHERGRRELAPRLRRRLPIDPADVRSAQRLLLIVAVLVTAADLLDKLVSPTLDEAYHARPLSVLAVMVGVTALGVITFPRTGSLSMAVAGGLLVGGGIGNTVSLLAWGRGIPNPLVSYRLGIAFNIADLCVGAGFALLLPAALIFMVRHQHELNAEL